MFDLKESYVCVCVGCVCVFLHVYGALTHLHNNVISLMHTWIDIVQNATCTKKVENWFVHSFICLVLMFRFFCCFCCHAVHKLQIKQDEVYKSPHSILINFIQSKTKRSVQSKHLCTGCNMFACNCHFLIYEMSCFKTANWLNTNRTFIYI